MNMPRPQLILVIPFLISMVAPCRAAFIYVGGSYEQDFNSLSNSGSTALWSNDSTLVGWFSTQSAYRIDNGNSTTSDLYSYGSTSSSDRALGSLTTNGTPQIQYSLQLQNGTGQSISEFTLIYTGEHWRGGGQARKNFLTFDYRFDAVSGINAVTGTTVNELTFGSIQTTGALDGNLAANRATLTHTVTGLSWVPGEYLTLRWTDDKLAGANHGLGIDDLTFSTNIVAVPEPTSLFALAAITLCCLAKRRASVGRGGKSAHR